MGELLGRITGCGMFVENERCCLYVVHGRKGSVNRLVSIGRNTDSGWITEGSQLSVGGQGWVWTEDRASVVGLKVNRPEHLHQGRVE
jgi:hypothetical protein